jgi:tetratricopeptide (TPR) repeat protein
LAAYLFVAAYLFSSLVFYVLSRLRAPVIPFMLMFAGFGLSELLAGLRQRRAAKAAIGIAAVAAVYLGSNLIPVPKQTYSAQAWTQQGNIYLSQHKPGKAVDAFHKALVALPNYYYARYCLVLGLAGAGRTAEAEAEYRALERAVAGSSERSNVERLAAARIAIAQSAEYDDPFRQQALRLASARLAIARRDFATAESLYIVTLAEDSTDAETSYLLGLVYISTKNLGAARQRLARAVALDPGHDAARAALKAVESRLGP